MNDLIECDRCASKIVHNNLHGRAEQFELVRHMEDGEGYNTKNILLCSMCLDELWAWAEPDDAPDRSSVADPVPLYRLADSVERHRDELDGLLAQIHTEIVKSDDE